MQTCDPVWIWCLCKLLTTASGLKFYWMDRSPAGWDGVWLLNMKSGKIAKPTVLCNKMAEIVGKPETITGDPSYPVYVSPFMIIDEE